MTELVRRAGIPREYGAVAPDESEDWRGAAIRRVARFFAVVRSRASFFRMILTGAAGGMILTQIRGFLEDFFLTERIYPTKTGYRLPGPLAAHALSSFLQGFALWSLDHPQEDALTLAGRFIDLVESGIFAVTKG